MKKSILFSLSILVAFGIAFYIKKEQYQNVTKFTPEWKTYVKKSGTEVANHKTTKEEFQIASISPPDAVKSSSSPGRSIASVDPRKGFMLRNNRILTGDVDHKYEDESTELSMVNKVNPNWKDLMGNGLMRFQSEDTKLMIKEEVPVIKVQDGQGRFLEQVTVTYLKDGKFLSSFRALVDSESGVITETWDRTVHENMAKRTRGELTLPTSNESGIITR